MLAISNAREQRQPMRATTHYLNEIRRSPLLDEPQERKLARNWRENGDRSAANTLVTSHLRLVAKVAVGFRGYGLPVQELIAEGNVGLLQALDRFDPERGFRFSTYAIWWIRAAIQDYILRSWSLVRLGTTTGQKKLFFKLRRAKSMISAFNEGDLRPDQVNQIATQLDVREQDVIDMNRRLSGDISLNAPIRNDGDGREWQEWLADDSPDQESAFIEQDQKDERREALMRSLCTLTPRERRIFEARRLAETPITLGTLALEFGLSRERVRQIEQRALAKVTLQVKTCVAARQNRSRGMMLATA